MSSITKSTGATLVSMLGAVQVTANTTARAVHTIASTLDMLDQYVQDARVAQIANSENNRLTMLDRLQLEASIEAAKHQAMIQREIDADPVLASLFKENFTKFAANREVIESKIKAIDNRISLS